MSTHGKVISSNFVFHNSHNRKSLLIIIQHKINVSEHTTSHLNKIHTNKYVEHDPTSIHTYIIGHYNPSVRIIDLASHTTYVVCVHFMHKWRDLQFKVHFERHIFARICWEEIAEGLLFVFCFDVWPGPGFTSNKPTHYLLDYGYFMVQ